MTRHTHAAQKPLNESTAVPLPRTGVGLALGGGFARGFAHLGVLQVFEQHEIPISHMAGASVGSILGAAYASGAPLRRIIETCRSLRFRAIARWRVSGLGLASNQRLAILIARVFESRQFEDLQIPLAVVATDLTSGEPVVFTQGNLVDAIRASCAFPGLFEPMQIGTRYLADGGLVAPVPTCAARSLGAALVIGVSVGMQDGHRGAPTNIFQVVSRAVNAAQSTSSKSGSATPTSSFAPTCSLWPGMISTAPMKRSRREPQPPTARCRASRNCSSRRRKPRSL